MSKINIRGAGGDKSGGGGGGGIESPDDFSTRAFVEIVEIVCEGEVGGLVAGDKSIFLDNTAVRNDNGDKVFKGVGWAQRKGTPTQTVIKYVQSVASEEAIGVRITDANPVIRTISDLDADRAVVTLGFPRLAYLTGKGDIVGTPCQMKMTIRANGGAWKPYINPHDIGYSIPDGYGTAPNHWAIKADQDSQECELYLWRETDETDVTVYYSVNNGSSWENWGIATFSYDVAKNKYRAHANIRLVGLGNQPLTVKWEAAGDSPPDILSVWMESAVFHYLHGQLNCGGKSMSRAQRQFRIDFEDYGNGPWDIKVERVTPDSTDAKRSDESWWDLLRTEKLARLTYPHSALIWLRIPAARFSSVPSRKYLMKLLLVRVPDNYNPKTRNYAGVWDGTFKTAWTDNPAWCFYDLATDSRYGLGQFIPASAIDKWSLYTLAQYCDEPVDSGKRKSNGAVIYEPRFTCNVHIRTRAEAYKVLMQLLSLFRGMLFVAGGVLQAGADMPSDPVQLFTCGNVVDGQFSYSGSAHRARHTVALVEWRDPEDMYNPKVEYVENRAGIDRYGVNTTETIAVGAVSRGQAHRQGHWILESELADTDVVAFKCGLDSTALKPGDVIAVQDNFRSGVRWGGRAAASTLSVVTLDAAVEMDSTVAYRLSIMLADGTTATRDIDAATFPAPGVQQIADINLVSALPLAAAENAIWVLQAAAIVEPTLWRIISITEQEGLTAQITALSHDPDKYARIESVTMLADNALSSVSPKEQLAPDNVSVYGNWASLPGGGAFALNIILSWERTADTLLYEIRHRRVDGLWRLNTTEDLNLELWGLVAGDYEFEVVAIHPGGRRSPPASVSFTSSEFNNVATLAAVESGADSVDVTASVEVLAAMDASEPLNDSAAMQANVIVTGAVAAIESGTDSASMAVVTPPSMVSLTLSSNYFYTGDTALVTFVFDQAATLTNAAITAQSGTLSTVSSSDGGVTYTATFTPTPGELMTAQKIAVNMAAVYDAEGTYGSGTAYSPEYTVYTIRCATVALDMPMNGSNGSTTFTDNSPNPKTFTAYGNAQISTAESVSDGASAYFDGAGDYIETPNHANFSFGTGDFSIEMDFFNQGTGPFIAVSSYSGWYTTVNFVFGYRQSNGYLYFLAGNQFPINIVSDAPFPATSGWKKIAVWRFNGVTKMAINDVKQSQSHSGSVSLSSTSTFRIGISHDNDGPVSGYIDNVFITKA